MSNLPADVTPKMLDRLEGLAPCSVCDQPTEMTCEVCDASVCELEQCEDEHTEQTGHGVGALIYVPPFP